MSSNPKIPDSELAIKVENLSKVYPLYNSPRDRLKEALSPSRKKYHHDFYALKDVSFEVKKGETFGIIGQNGSGKSTLLKILSNVLTPTGGNIEVKGKVSSLLELGTGFNPELTGIENIYFSGTLLGFSKEEMDNKLHTILKFADIGEFVRQPVKTYSSGMYVRLAFAVISHVDAEVLIIDEALAVGDVFFQQKCMRYLTEFQNSGGTILFVSHDPAAIIALCHRVILLPNNRDDQPLIGTADEISKIYVNQIYSERDQGNNMSLLGIESIPGISEQSKSIKNSNNMITLEGYDQPENVMNISEFRKGAESFGTGGVKITNVWFEDQSGNKISKIIGGQSVVLCIKAEANQIVNWPAFGFILKDRLGQYLIAEGTDMPFRKHSLIFMEKDVIIVKFSFIAPILYHGHYSLDVAIAEGQGDDHFQHHWIHDALLISSLKSRIIHGIYGLQNLKIKMEIFNLKNEDL